MKLPTMKPFTTIALLLSLPLAVPVAAQTDPLAKRVGTLESQMHAVQRKVFPTGDPRYFTPEIAAESAPTEPVGSPSTSALVDLTSRVDSLERQQRQLTGQIEENQFKIRQLEETLTKFRGDTEFRLTAIEGPKQAAAAPVGAPTSGPVSDPVPDAAPPAAPAPTKPSRAPAKAEPDAAPDAPATPAAIEASWRAAYALYVAKDYTHAETSMQDFLTANPKAVRASNAQYWLGRSYMAQAKYAQSAKAFLDGYQKYAKGDRAPDSLLWLGNALAALKKPDQACRALNELQSVYGDKLTPALTEQAGKARAGAKCDA